MFKLYIHEKMVEEAATFREALKRAQTISSWRTDETVQCYDPDYKFVGSFYAGERVIGF